MKRFQRFFATAAVAVVLGAGGFGITAGRAQEPAAGDAANGQRIYLADGCFTCHGRAGQGGNYYGTTPILAKTALPIEGFKMQVRNPVRVMPAYSDAVLSDQGDCRHVRVPADPARAAPGQGHPDPQRLRPFIGRERACEKLLRSHTRSSSRKKKSSSAHSRESGNSVSSQKAWVPIHERS